MTQADLARALAQKAHDDARQYLAWYRLRQPDGGAGEAAFDYLARLMQQEHMSRTELQAAASGLAEILNQSR